MSAARAGLAGRPEPMRAQPQRRCVVCGAVGPKLGLVRVLRTADGRIALDEGGRGQGRGAYLCRRPECLGSAEVGPRLGRGLRRRLTDTQLQGLQADLGQAATKTAAGTRSEP